jgi:taurine dioxygenase
MPNISTTASSTRLPFKVMPNDAPLGNEVVGLDLSQEIDDETFKALESAFNECSVLVFRNQKLSPENHIRFSRRFGDLEVHVMEQYLLPGYPEIFRVSNIVEDGKRIGGSGEFWHTDLSYVAQPSRGSLLYSIEVPHKDGQPLGDTQFASMVAAYDSLPEATKKRIEGLKAVHRFGDVYAKVAQVRGATSALTSQQKSKLPDVIHPIVHVHPFTGRKSLFVNEGFTVGVVGMSDEEGGALLQELFAHCIRPDLVYTHKWRVGDLVMWDNWATQHRGTGGYTADQRRLMMRTTLKGSVPF